MCVCVCLHILVPVFICAGVLYGSREEPTVQVIRDTINAINYGSPNKTLAMIPTQSEDIFTLFNKGLSDKFDGIRVFL